MQGKGEDCGGLQQGDWWRITDSKRHSSERNKRRHWQKRIKAVCTSASLSVGPVTHTSENFTGTLGATLSVKSSQQEHQVTAGILERPAELNMQLFLNIIVKQPEINTFQRDLCYD